MKKFKLKISIADKTLVGIIILNGKKNQLLFRILSSKNESILMRDVSLLLNALFANNSEHMLEGYIEYQGEKSEIEILLMEYFWKNHGITQFNQIEIIMKKDNRFFLLEPTNKKQLLTVPIVNLSIHPFNTKKSIYPDKL